MAVAWWNEVLRKRTIQPNWELIPMADINKLKKDNDTRWRNMKVDPALRLSLVNEPSDIPRYRHRL
jgi:hypothetical protein